MHIVVYTPVAELGRRVRLAAKDPKDVLSLIMILDQSPHVQCWNIENHTPNDFGWGDTGWNKHQRVISQ